jgi:antirestriction protein
MSIANTVANIHQAAAAAENDMAGVLEFIKSNHYAEHYDNVNLVTEASRVAVLQNLFGGMGDSTDNLYVHYWEASSYNEGFYIGQFFDLEAYDTLEDLEEARTEWMQAIELVGMALDLTSCYGDEWLDGDIDAECADTVEEYYEIHEAMNGSCYSLEVFQAAMALGLPLSEVDEKYQGEHESDTDLAYAFIEDTGMLSDVPDSISIYFNYEQFGRDMAMNDYHEHNGHYFLNC